MQEKATTVEPVSQSAGQGIHGNDIGGRRPGLTGDVISDSQFGRVVDVPLAVTLRFGQREMRLREVLELTTGSLVHLDRQVDEPVDLLLGERIIARGEVVIVDGNYGLRVTEIVQGASFQASFA